MSYEASVKSSNKVTSGVFTIKLIEPYMYWTPKFHKTPVKFCFIVSSILFLVLGNWGMYNIQDELLLDPNYDGQSNAQL